MAGGRRRFIVGIDWPGRRYRASNFPSKSFAEKVGPRRSTDVQSSGSRVSSGAHLAILWNITSRIQHQSWSSECALPGSGAGTLRFTTSLSRMRGMCSPTRCPAISPSLTPRLQDSTQQQAPRGRGHVRSHPQARPLRRRPETAQRHPDRHSAGKVLDRRRSAAQRHRVEVTVHGEPVLPDVRDKKQHL